MSNSTCIIPANTDVLGIGVRINFYCTMVLLALVPRTPHTKELLNVLYSNAEIAGLALLVTAIQQTAAKQLSLFHAIFIQHILFFLGIGSVTTAPIGKYHWSRSRIVMGFFIRFASVIAYTSWALYMWFHVENFGIATQSPCKNNEDVKYVLMFVSVKATEDWLRELWKGILFCSVQGLLGRLGVDAHTALRHNEDKETEQSKEGWYLFMPLSQFFSAIYCITMLELIVHRNSTGQGGVVEIDDKWAFGQILSVVMIIANMNEVIHFLFGFIARRRERSRERQAEEQLALIDTDVPPASTSYQPKRHPGSHLSSKAYCTA